MQRTSPGRDNPSLKRWWKSLNDLPASFGFTAPGSSRAPRLLYPPQGKAYKRVLAMLRRLTG